MFHTLNSVVMALAVATPVFAADPVLGTFKTEPGDTGSFAHVEIYECGASVCGAIRKAFDASGAEVASDNVGKRMIWDMAAKGNGAYAGGKIWAPDRNKTYSSKMELSGQTLRVSGCVAIICRAQTWTRVK